MARIPVYDGLPRYRTGGTRALEARKRGPKESSRRKGYPGTTIARLIQERHHRWGFTPQKPLRRAYERDPEAVKRWLRQDSRVSAKRVSAEKGLLDWGDEMGMRSDHQAGPSRGRKGQTPVIPGTGQGFRCNMISALTNQGQLSWLVFRKRLAAPVMPAFLRRRLRHPQRKAVLVLVRSYVQHESVRDAAIA